MNRNLTARAFHGTFCRGGSFRTRKRTCIMVKSFWSSIVRRRRVYIVALVIWSLAFAQAAVAAHACAMLSLTSPAQVAQTNTPPMPPGCAEMAKRSGSTTNLCQSHCLAGQHVYGQLDIPTASVAPQPSLAVRITEAWASVNFTASSFAPLATAPPSRLRFSRFLI